MTKKFILSQEDGTIEGGNTRGNFAVDLQMVRSNANQVAGSSFAVIIGGENNRVTAGYSTIIGGTNNIASGAYAFVGGGSGNSLPLGASQYIVLNGGLGNTATGYGSVVGGGVSNNNTSSRGVISGGESNTTSGSHATVVGGLINLSSGAYSISGGYNNVASGSYSVAIGSRSQATNLNSIAIGGWSASGGALASGQFSVALGYTTQALGSNSIAIGGAAYASGGAAVAFQNARAEQNHSIAFGLSTKGYFEFGFSLADGRFAQNGDAQISFFPRKTVDTLTSGGTTILNGGTPSGSNRAWNVTVKWVAVITDNGGAAGITVGDSIASSEQLLFKRVGGVSSVVGAASTLSTHSDASMVGCSMAYTAGASQQLALTFTGPTFASGGPVTCRIVAKVELTEVAY
jgi:hypothetical protein